jgi:hypothetical protein
MVRILYQLWNSHGWQTIIAGLTFIVFARWLSLEIAKKTFSQLWESIQKRQLRSEEMRDLRQFIYSDLGRLICHGRDLERHFKERPFSTFPEPAKTLIAQSYLNQFFDDLSLWTRLKNTDRVLDKRKFFGEEAMGIINIDQMLQKLPARTAPETELVSAVCEFLYEAKQEAIRSKINWDKIENAVIQQH